jgi:hypothetical protein
MPDSIFFKANNPREERKIKKLIQEEIAKSGGGPGGAVSSVNGQTGAVTITKTSVGLGNVDNTTDINKPISTAQATVNATKVDKITPITGATKTKVTYNAQGQVTAGVDATMTDIVNVPTANLNAGSITGQLAINELAQRLTTEEAKSNITKKGNLPTGGTKAAPVAITAGSMPLSVIDGDYYTVATVNTATANYYDLTAIGYGIVNAGMGAKISFNATQNEYIFQNAGENQTASEVSTTPVVASATTIADPSTNLENSKNFILAEIKSLQNKNIGAFEATKAYLANDKITENGHIYQANANFTSTATFVATDWTDLTPRIINVAPATYANLATQITATNNNEITKDTTTGNIVIKDSLGNAQTVTPASADVETLITTTLTAGTATIATTATQPALTALVLPAMTGEVTIVNRVTGEMWRRVKGETIFDLIQGRQSSKGINPTAQFNATTVTVLNTTDTAIIADGAIPTAGTGFEGVALEVTTAGTFLTVEYAIGDIIYCENTGSGFVWKKLDNTDAKVIPYRTWGWSNPGAGTLGDDFETAEINNTEIKLTSATLHIKSGTFPATPSIMKIKSGAVDYITVNIPANQTVGTIPCTIAIADVPAGTELILNNSADFPSVVAEITSSIIA